MKIIRKGWDIQKRLCNNCGSLFEFEDYGTGIEKDKNINLTYKYIICPVCNNKIKLKIFI